MTAAEDVNDAVREHHVEAVAKLGRRRAIARRKLAAIERELTEALRAARGVIEMSELARLAKLARPTVYDRLGAVGDSYLANDDEEQEGDD